MPKPSLIYFEFGVVLVNYKKFSLRFALISRLKVQQESGVLLGEIVFVDDKAENLVAPQSLGWQTVLFDRLQAEAGVARIKSLLAI